ncbi:EF-hand calcium-binding domain-containing protein 11-like [Babylonia areolata]|uniref:EF-hand calcium-binding domain-containing protein 11-like n=1 Tax=Babylonia areolata TaxID=304850 RepID=UPI003FD346B8
MAAALGFRLTGLGYSHLIRNLTKSEHNLLRKIFAEADEGGKDFLTRADLKIAVISMLGYKPSKYEANQILEKYGHTLEDGTSVLNLGQFIEAMTPKLIIRDEDDEIRQTFMAFDTHCKGFLTVDDLKKVFSQLAPHMGHHRIESIFKELDRDGDGRVSYKDFDFMMKYDPLS